MNWKLWVIRPQSQEPKEKTENEYSVYFDLSYGSSIEFVVMPGAISSRILHLDP